MHIYRRQVENQNFPFDRLGLFKITGLHTQKAYTHTGTASHQILLLSAHAYMHFARELQLDSQCVHHDVRIQV